MGGPVGLTRGPVLYIIFHYFILVLLALYLKFLARNVLVYLPVEAEA